MRGLFTSISALVFAASVLACGRDLFAPVELTKQHKQNIGIDSFGAVAGLGWAF